MLKIAVGHKISGPGMSNLENKCSKMYNNLSLKIVFKFLTSWAMTSALDLSPESKDGVAKVRHGFSIPPKGKEGGRIRISYSPQTYGPHRS